MLPNQKYFYPFIVLFIIAISPMAFAQTFNVSNTPELRQALKDAAGNGKSDIIMLADGTYKTTDDGGGTFVFLDNENYDLTIQGSSADRVILSGDDTDQVLNFNVVNYEPTIYFVNFSVLNGKSETPGGGGFFLGVNLNIKNCKFEGNAAVLHFAGNFTPTGGGFYYSGTTTSNITIVGSTIAHNTAGSAYGSGGGFYSIECSNITIINSTIANNSVGGGGGGGFISMGYSSINITDSTISNNSADGGGGGFFSTGAVTIVGSSIADNASGTGGGGFFSTGVSRITITDSIIANNTSDTDYSGFFSSGTTKIINSILINNNSEHSVYIVSGTDHYVINSMFINNGTHDVGGQLGVVATFYNNYIDATKINVTAFKKDNIFGGNLDFTDQANGDFHIEENSILIDAGTINIDGISLSATDLDGNQRISGAGIDIGPYEFSSTRPTINSFTHTGILKINETIAFNIDATPTIGRAISKYEIDIGNGEFEETTSSSDHIFDTPGAYNITVKVTDIENEYSTKRISINIADLSETEKLNIEFERGKQFVIDNYNQFDFVTISDKDQAVANAEAAKDAIITQKDATIASMFTQTQLSNAVADAEAIKDDIIAQRDKSITILNTTIASMFTKAQMDEAIVDAEAAKDVIIEQKDKSITVLNTTIASMFTKLQMDKAVSDAEAAKDAIITQKDATIAQQNKIISDLDITITNLNTTIAAMFSKEDVGKAVSNAEAAKDEIIAAMFTQEQLEQAISDAEALKDLLITEKNDTISNLNATINIMFTQEQLDQAVSDAEGIKDAVIDERDQTITDLNEIITSMYTEEQFNEAVDNEQKKWDVDGDGTVSLLDIIYYLNVLSGQEKD